MPARLPAREPGPVRARQHRRAHLATAGAAFVPGCCDAATAGLPSRAVPAALAASPDDRVAGRASAPG